MEEIFDSEWTFAKDVLLSKYKLPIMTKQEEEASCIENRVGLLQKQMANSGRSYLKYQNAVKFLDTEWNNIPVPLHEAVKLFKQAVYEVQSFAKIQAEELKSFWEVYGLESRYRRDLQEESFAAARERDKLLYDQVIREAEALHELSIKHAEQLQIKILEEAKKVCLQEIKDAISVQNQKTTKLVNDSTSKIKAEIQDQFQVYRKEIFDIEGLVGPRETYKSLSAYLRALAARLDADQKKTVAKIYENSSKISATDMELFKLNKKIVELYQLNAKVESLETKLASNIEAQFGDLTFEIDKLKGHVPSGIDATLLRLLGSGGEWKILIGRVDNLEKFMFEKQSSSSLSSGSGSVEDEVTEDGLVKSKMSNLSSKSSSLSSIAMSKKQQQTASKNGDSSISRGPKDSGLGRSFKDQDSVRTQAKHRDPQPTHYKFGENESNASISGSVHSVHQVAIKTQKTNKLTNNFSDEEILEVKNQLSVNNKITTGNSKIDILKSASQSQPPTTVVKSKFGTPKQSDMKVSVKSPKQSDRDSLAKKSASVKSSTHPKKEPFIYTRTADVAAESELNLLMDDDSVSILSSEQGDHNQKAPKEPVVIDDDKIQVTLQKTNISLKNVDFLETAIITSEQRVNSMSNLSIKDPESANLANPVKSAGMLQEQKQPPNLNPLQKSILFLNEDKSSLKFAESNLSDKKSPQPVENILQDSKSKVIASKSKALDFNSKVTTIQSPNPIAEPEVDLNKKEKKSKKEKKAEENQEVSVFEDHKAKKKDKEKVLKKRGVDTQELELLNQRIDEIMAFINEFRPIPEITKSLQVSLNNLKKMEKLDQLMDAKIKSPKQADAKAALANMFSNKFANTFKTMAGTGAGDKAAALNVSTEQKTKDVALANLMNFTKKVTSNIKMENFETVDNSQSKWTGKLNLLNIHIPNTAREQETTLQNTLRDDVVVSSKAYSKSPPKKMGPDQVTVETLINTSRQVEQLNVLEQSTDKVRPGTQVMQGARRKNTMQDQKDEFDQLLAIKRIHLMDKQFGPQVVDIRLSSAGSQGQNSNHAQWDARQPMQGQVIRNLNNKDIEREFTTIKGYAQRKEAQSHMRKLYKPVQGQQALANLSSRGSIGPIVSVAFEGMHDVDLTSRMR